MISEGFGCHGIWDTGGVGCPGRRDRLIASPKGCCGGAGRVLHEVWVLLTDRWVYSTGVRGLVQYG